MRFDLLSLKLFVAVCEQQSISRAADAEHIAASAVSKRISDLEKRIKAPLFYRSQKGLELTATGNAFLHHARVILRDLVQLEMELADHGKGARGQVRLHASVSTIVQHLPRDIADFLALHPSIRIDLKEAVSKDVVRSVSENVADIGIFGGSLPVAGLSVVPYRSDRLVVIAPRGHPLSGATTLKFHEVAAHDLVGPQPGSYLESLIMRAAADLGDSLKLRIRVNGFETAASMVEAGLGVALVAEKRAEHYVMTRPLVAIRLDEAWAERHWKLCTRELPSLPAPVRLLLKHLSSRHEAPSVNGSGERNHRSTGIGAVPVAAER